MGVLLVEPAVNENSIEATKLDPSTVVSTLAKTKEIIGKKVEEVVGSGIVPDYKYHKSTGGATVCDENGNNLVNNQIYGDIAMAGDKLFMVGNLDEGVAVFSIPEKKIIEEKANEVVPVQEEVQPLETTPVENETVKEATFDNNVVPVQEEVAPTELSNIFGGEEPTDIGENITIPAVDNFSFGEIEEETPATEVDGGEDTVVEDNYDSMQQSEVEKTLDSLKSKNDALTELDGEITSMTKDPFADYQFKADEIEYSKDSDNSYEMRDELEIVPDETAKEIVKAFEDLGQENANKDRLLADKDHIIAEKDHEIEKLRLSDEKKDNQIRGLEQRNEALTSTVREAREVIAKKDAEIERARNAADIFKGKADGYKYELSEKERENAKLRSQLEAYEYLKNQWERIKTAKNYSNSYEDVDSYIKY